MRENNEKIKMDCLRYEKGISFLGKKYMFYRALRSYKNSKNKKFWQIIKRYSLRGTGCDIGFFKCGGGLYIPRFSGIIISKFAVIGENATIFQQVTIGVKNYGELKAPVIGDNVCIGAGAKIIGDIKIGNNVKIGANAVVTKNVPDNCTVIEFNKILKGEN